MTITVGHTEPGAELRPNWLPAPEGPFRLVMRLYIPGDAVLDGTYAFPKIIRA